MGKQGERLLELARERFYDGREELTRAERILFEAVAEGEEADLSDLKEGGSRWDSLDESPWPDTVVIPADRIAWLCTDKRAMKLVTHRGIWLRAAGIVGMIDLAFSQVSFPLVLRGCSIPAGIVLLQAKTLSLYFDGSKTGWIKGDGLQAQGAVHFRHGFQARGEVNLLGADIAGNLDCVGGKLLNQGGYALVADGIKVKGAVFLRDDFKAQGEVRLLGADIGLSLDCKGGKFINPDGIALGADGSKVAGYVMLQDGFEAQGEVLLLGADIGGNLECNSAKFLNKGRSVLCMEGIKVKGHLFLRDGIRLEGEVSLVAADIGLGFSLRNVLQNSRVLLDLRNARIGTLFDDEESWPRLERENGELVSGIHLDGFVYNHIDDHSPKDAKRRQDWLSRQPAEPFRPQPYEQLAKVLRESGHDSDATRILVAKGTAKRKSLWRAVRRPTEQDKKVCLFRRLARLAWQGVSGALIGYGYRPWQALLWLLGLFVLGAAIFWAADTAGVMVPVKQRYYVIQNGNKIEPQLTWSDYQRFQPAMYSLDAMLPVGNLNQVEHWLPSPKTVAGCWVRWYYWAHVFFGWFFSIFGLAGLTGLIKK